MRFLNQRLSVGTAALCVTACASFAEPSPTMTGRRLASRDCGACHAVGDRDVTLNPTAIPFRELGAKYQIDGLGEALAEGISVGHPDMPDVDYPAEEVEALIAYLKALQPQRPDGGAR